MMKLLIIAAAMVATVSAAAQQVEVGEGDWSDIPRVSTTGRHRMSSDALDRAAVLLSRGGACANPTGSRDIDRTIPFMVEFASDDAAIKRIVVHRADCPELEKLVGGVVLTLAQKGEYKATGENQAHWYRGEISFQIN